LLIRLVSEQSTQYKKL